ncbi:MerR family transcriptional regulator [Flavobacteriaceae bacterium F89]|uniref:MerR family transcriptional regulator n=1 Tax=Cerina litoralis TaxID=2874477 RepID=A0AAE3ER88_9FLAO|nr:MerR family transcriptional regulator [Cerina litoralis]MCG2459503.1 MerR family transcriptional regulator [Cerina litoralis]
MNKVKEAFSIRDLENLSGIKAHTIRIWEKRYGLLEPERTDTNIRSYNLENLQKLLNITVLYNNGYKISKIASLPNSEIPVLVHELSVEENDKDHIINSLKLAMVKFDQVLFHSTYNELTVNKSFRDIFSSILIPLLNQLGILWQTDSIHTSHEHFMAGLIRQKIIANTEKLQLTGPTGKDRTFVLFLPDNEIHDIGLLYINYELLLRGFKTIYLGQTVPIISLKDLEVVGDNLHFVSYFTVQPTKDKLENYIAQFDSEINLGYYKKLWVLGRQTQYLDKEKLPGHIETFESIQALVQKIEA